MKLADILRKTGITEIAADAEVSGVSNNSGTVRAGDVFIAIKGTKVNGADFIGAAVAKGAAAVITDEENRNIVEASKYPGIPVIFADNIRAVESRMAAAFYSRQPGFVAAVTGTNGKSSVVNFMRQMWEMTGVNSASIGTVGIQTTELIGKKTLTTPDSIDLHRSLDELAAEGITHAAIETSSHGIEQHRVDSLKISAAGFTNISNDHLDYHKDIDEYFHAKLRLFSELLSPSGTAVVNIDDARGAEVARACRARGIKVATYGRGEADIRLAGYEIKDSRQNVALEVGGKRYSITLNLVTEFQVYNFMCALGMFMASTKEWERVLPHAAELKNERGRIEYVGKSPNGAPIFVDFGHNGDGLRKLLTQFRPYVKHNLVCIAGSSGDRPEIRRVEMGRVLNEFADTVVIADDNPRTEDPAAIRATLLKYCPKARVIPDRYAAINEVIDTSREWDSIIICGTMYERDKEFIRAKLAPHTVGLASLLQNAGFAERPAEGDPLISSISSNSHTVKPGGIFVGIRGFTRNGADFAAEAVANGAKCVVVEEGYEFDGKTSAEMKAKGVLAIRAKNTRKALADLVYNFYDRRQPDTMVAVTGTSGKSSVVDFARQLWAEIGLPAISAGTIGVIAENVYSGKRIIKYGDSDYTTPVSDEIYKFLNYFKSKGVEYGAVELSSHGLDQLRLENVKIKAGGFTNLGTDHMDFYGGYDGYLESKAKLFRETIVDGGTAVLNADIPEFEYFEKICRERGLNVLSYGTAGRDLRIISQKVSLDGQDAELMIFGKRRRVRLQILGAFQLMNLLCAIGLVAAVTPEWERALPKLGNLKNAIGRLEYMGRTKRGASVYIDFSYKGDALTHTLKTLRTMTGNRIVLVFSTCGDVYETRRRKELGEAAELYSDIAILT
ncbi:MAG: UDP-N-acetylmuramyl-tripeptide synthetase, partial [Rickettsiales bacterium]|nr:UDP-N-acetylmuramyl-tripeptide synthetase [Rickettsiales bacterium]